MFHRHVKSTLAGILAVLCALVAIDAYIKLGKVENTAWCITLVSGSAKYCCQCCAIACSWRRS